MLAEDPQAELGIIWCLVRAVFPGPKTQQSVFGFPEDPWHDLGTTRCLMFAEDAFAEQRTMVCLVFAKEPWAELSTIGFFFVFA